MIKDNLRRIMTETRSRSGAGLLGFLLTLLACVYRVVLRGHRLCYDRGWFPRHDLHRPVISVGNITAGGVGKTPLVKTLIRRFINQGRQPVVLIRGYHARRMNGSLQSDEVQEYREQFPNVAVLAGRDRVRNARSFLRQQRADIFLLDDGFQHRCVKRDLDLVILDSTNPFGNGEVLPRGVLREPIQALRRANMIVLTKVDLGRNNLDEITRILGQQGVRCPVCHAIHQCRSFRDWRTNYEVELSSVKNQAVALVSAIGDPASFERMVCALEVQLKEHFVFPDHHWFTRKDWETILADCHRQQVELLITTGKDAIRLNSFKRDIPESLRFYILQIELTITYVQEDFYKRIDRVLQR